MFSFGAPSGGMAMYVDACLNRTGFGCKLCQTYLSLRNECQRTILIILQASASILRFEALVLSWETWGGRGSFSMRHVAASSNR